MTQTKATPKLVCPACGNRGMFDVFVPQLVGYVYYPETGDWQSHAMGSGSEPQPTGGGYIVSCGDCATELGEFEPWD